MEDTLPRTRRTGAGRTRRAPYVGEDKRRRIRRELELPKSVVEDFDAYGLIFFAAQLVDRDERREAQTEPS